MRVSARLVERLDRPSASKSSASAAGLGSIVTMRQREPSVPVKESPAFHCAFAVEKTAGSAGSPLRRSSR